MGIRATYNKLAHNTLMQNIASLGLVQLANYAIPLLMGQGVGSELLRQMRQQYAGKGVFLEIEQVTESAENYEERKRRKRFYLSNGMTELGVFVELFGVEMELLGFDCTLTFEEYHAFYRDNYNEWAAEHVKLPKNTKA